MLKECLHVLFRILPWLLTETVVAMAIDYGYYFPGKFLQHCQDALAQLRIGWPGACEGWVQLFVRDDVFVTKLKQMMRKSRNELFIYTYNNSMQVDCNLFCIFFYCVRCKDKAKAFRTKPLQPVQMVSMLSYIINWLSEAELWFTMSNKNKMPPFERKSSIDCWSLDSQQSAVSFNIEITSTLKASIFGQEDWNPSMW